MTNTVFISWSGGSSHFIASAIKTWLETYMQKVKVFLSSDNIDIGKVWAKETAANLFASNFGILVVTEANISSPWLLFEAGALSKNIDKATVCPLLCDVSIDSIPDPLRQFQCASISKAGDIERLLASINNSLGEDALTDKTLARIIADNSKPLFKAISKGLKVPEETNIHDILADAFAYQYPLAKLLSTRTLLYVIHNWVAIIHKESMHKYVPVRRNIDGSYAEQLVSYDEETGNLLFLIHKNARGEHHWYDLSWGALSSSSNLVQMIFHLQEKTWFTPDHLSQFLDLIDTLCRSFLNQSASYAFQQKHEIKWPTEAVLGPKREKTNW